MTIKQWRVFALINLIANSVSGNTATDATLTDITSHPAWAKLNKFDCGESVADRIIGGNNAALGQFPWAAHIGYLVKDAVYYACGGALISDRHVITAAHCTVFEDSTPPITVRLGEYDTVTDPDCQRNICAPPVQDRGIKSIFVHPKNEKSELHNDIAILELQTPVVLNDFVAPICLPREKEQMVKPPIGDRLSVIGWGVTNTTTHQLANVLQVVVVPILNSERCNVFGPKFRILYSELCAGAVRNKDSCGGDSGGPLMKVFDTPEGPKSYLLGAVSFGPAVCGIQKPAIYTWIPYFMKWILDTIL